MKQYPGNSLATPVIMQILPSLRSGGVERGTVDMANALVEHGYDALVVSNGGAMVGQLTQSGAEHVKLPVHRKTPWGMYNNIGRLIQTIRQYKVDIIHARSRAPAWPAYIASKRLGVPFVTTFHGTYGLSGAGKKWYNSVMTKGDRVIAVSQFIAEHIKQHYEIDEGKLRVIPRGIDMRYFNPAVVGRVRMMNLLTQLQLPEDLPIILLPGRITAWKGQRLLVEALSRISHKEYCCLLVGEDVRKGKYRRELQQDIIDKGLQSHVRIIPQQSDMPALYMLSDIVISASTEPEAFGRVAVEGQAMGRSVIATSHGGACETIIDGKTGWLTSPEDPDELASKIEMLLNMAQDKREEYANHAREHVRAHFSLEKMCQSTLNIYKELL